MQCFLNLEKKKELSFAFNFCDKLQYNIYENAQYLGNDENKYHVLIIDMTRFRGNDPDAIRIPFCA